MDKRRPIDEAELKKIAAGTKVVQSEMSQDPEGLTVTDDPPGGGGGGGVGNVDGDEGSNTGGNSNFSRG